MLSHTELKLHESSLTVHYRASPKTLSGAFEAYDCKVFCVNIELGLKLGFSRVFIEGAWDYELI